MRLRWYLVDFYFLSAIKVFLQSQGIPVLTEVQETAEDIMGSIKELRCNSSAGPDGVPAVIEKGTQFYYSATKPLVE